MRNKIVFPIVAALALSTASLLHADVIVNGGFDAWAISSTNGTTLSGTPSSWTYSGNTAPIQGPVLRAGSGYSAVMINGTSTFSTTGVFSQSVAASNLSAFTLSFDLAVARNGTNREFQLILGQTSGQTINLIFVGGSTGKMTVQANDLSHGGGFTNLGGAAAVDAMNDSGAYNSTTNSFANLQTYRISMTVDWASVTPSYSFSFTPDGGSTTTLVTNSNYFFQAPTVGGVLQSVQFFGANSATGGYYALDNVSLSTIPEPTTLALMAGGFLLLGARRLRRLA